MDIGIYIVIGIVALVLIIIIGWWISTSNNFRRTEVKINEAESGIDVALTKRYDTLTVLSNRDPATGGGEHMEIVISFFVTVAAGVTCHLICKWLDRHNKDNK